MIAQPAQTQALEALAIATEQRLAISAIRAQVKQHEYREGMVFVAGLFRNPSAPVMSMRVEDLLKSVRRISHVRILEIMTAAGIRTVGRRVRDLTQRQRNVIAADLERRARGWQATR